MKTMTQNEKTVTVKKVPGRKALVVVDVQIDFCPEGNLAVPNGQEVVEVANYLSDGSGFDYKVLTKDWHPKNHCSFASSHPGKQLFETVTLENGVNQMLWPDHCIQDDDGAQFHPALDTECDKVIIKGTDIDVDSHSAFLDNAQNRSTGLLEYLNENEVTDVYVMGLATEVCVKLTVLDSVNLGFNTFVITDGCRAVNDENGKKAFKEMADATAILVTSEDIKVCNSL